MINYNYFKLFQQWWHALLKTFLFSILEGSKITSSDDLWKSINIQCKKLVNWYAVWAEFLHKILVCETKKIIIFFFTGVTAVDDSGFSFLWWINYHTNLGSNCRSLCGRRVSSYRTPTLYEGMWLVVSLSLICVCPSVHMEERPKVTCGTCPSPGPWATWFYPSDHEPPDPNLQTMSHLTLPSKPWATWPYSSQSNNHLR